jgi:hypothetical protein
VVFKARVWFAIIGLDTLVAPIVSVEYVVFWVVGCVVIVLFFYLRFYLFVLLNRFGGLFFFNVE